MRIVIKGGVWKNTEDEILKAAVMKYGKNQWARISSLLVRKTPKQCKARWFEWIDPSIKKTEWSRDEDEKLLHLAKLMPTQWRTIAPIVGRTPAQCLERYQKLLDDAEAHISGKKDDLSLQGPQGGESGDATAEDIRRLRPGEIDPDPETKPARPDPVDMDEDEKEMLSEARARLANTQGKKAKRKARERQLEEAKRLASLQKRRELKAAGIEIKKKKKRKHLDYNADIPFEKKPMPGFYETYDEISNPIQISSQSGKKLQDIEPKKRWEIEEEANKNRQDKKSKKSHTGKGDSDSVAFVRSKLDASIIAKEQEHRLASRKPLVLPEPQVGDTELESIVRIAQQGEIAQGLLDSDIGTSSILLGDYSSAPTQLGSIRTPQSAAQTDTIMAEALNLRGLTSQQTPLLGEENTPLHLDSGTGYQGITPRTNVVQTPNPLMSPFRTPGSVLTSNNGQGHGDGLGQTPFRDELGLNTPSSILYNGGATPADISAHKKAMRSKLRSQLSSLPAPKNQFEIVLPELEEELDSFSDTKLAEDQEVIEKRKAQELLDEQEKMFERRSTPVKLGLPRPSSMDSKRADDLRASLPLEFQQAMSLIDLEMEKIVLNDYINFPPSDPGTSFKKICLDSVHELEDISDNRLKDARLEMMNEYESMKNQFEKIDLEAHNSILTKNLGKFIWVPSTHDFVSQDKIEIPQLIESKKLVFERRISVMAKEAVKATKMEKKQSVLLGGYIERSKDLCKKIDQTNKEIVDARLQYHSFSFLQACEKASIPSRIGDLELIVSKLEMEENELQKKYKELMEDSTA
ncbi:Pre-mRNA-splicing factor CEF1 [Smittium mucronatum]|uniref:Pre-mRNA-splicing factor CEF1 n=1 Tax=Smittium mucronatum TaxID=133383 RepID=A0A1R0H0U4_9FUNG|nr:Pre-mRNA-splicing factor CEF1 [Smittium mucronatum]